MEFITPPVISADFILRIAGDGMAPLFANNDLVACINADAVPDGSIAVIRLDERTTLKRVFFTANGYMLESDNCDYPPMYVNRHDVEIIGRPVGLTRLLA